MTIFEKATLDAVKYLKEKKCNNLEVAWRIALLDNGASGSVIDKSCPRKTFADLCNNGYIKNISSYSNVELSENGRMAIEAIKILNANNWRINSKQAFWFQYFKKSYESQLDIILVLKNNNLLIN